MGLTGFISSLRNKAFTKVFRGYDPVDVNAYMKKIANQLETFSQDYYELKAKHKKCEVELIEYREREDLFKKTLSNATKMSDQIKTDSSREAKLIISDAQHRAEVIVRDAKDSLKRIYHDISELRRVRMQFEHNIKAILNSNLTMLEQGQRTLPDPVVDESRLKMDLKKLDVKFLNTENDFVEEEAEEVSSSKTEQMNQQIDI